VSLVHWFAEVDLSSSASLCINYHAFPISSKWLKWPWNAALFRTRLLDDMDTPQPFSCHLQSTPSFSIDRSLPPDVNTADVVFVSCIVLVRCRSV